MQAVLSKLRSTSTTLHSVIPQPCSSHSSPHANTLRSRPRDSRCSNTLDLSTVICSICFYTVCWMYWYRLQIKWDYRKNLSLVIRPNFCTYIRYRSDVCIVPRLSHPHWLQVNSSVNEMGLQLPVFASWSLFLSHESLTETDNVLSFCFRPDDKCHCGVFWNTMAEEPIISQSPNFVMLCDEEGRESCKAMCTSMVSLYVTAVVPETKIIRHKLCTLSLLPYIKAKKSGTSPPCQPLHHRHKFIFAKMS
jgi:hypothetical protein